MPRSPAQSDFSVTRVRDREPRAAVLDARAGEFATRWMLRLTVLLLAALAVLCLVAPHIPAGE